MGLTTDRSSNKSPVPASHIWEFSYQQRSSILQDHTCPISTRENRDEGVSVTLQQGCVRLIYVTQNSMDEDLTQMMLMVSFLASSFSRNMSFCPMRCVPV